MPASILIAYATRYGSTQEVAETMAATLREQYAQEVDVSPVREVQTLEGYDAVVLGAPLYIGSWSGDVRRFLSNYHEPLLKRPVAVFALGPLSREEQEMQGSREQITKELAKYPWLTPVAVEVFVGKYDPANLRFPDNLLTLFPASPLRNVPAKDLRDWDAIRAWTRTVAEKLQPVPAR